MPLVPMDAANLAKAQTNVATVINRGTDLTLSRASTKDKGGTPTSTTDITVKTFPTKFSPFDRRTVANVSWSDEVDIIWTIVFKDRNWKKYRTLYNVAKHDGVEYDISHVAPFGSFGNTFLYIKIGGVKKS